MTDDFDVKSDLSGSTGVDLHQEIALAVKQAISTHNAAYQAMLTRSEEQWQTAKEDALRALESSFQDRLEATKRQWDTDHATEKEQLSSQLRSAQSEVMRYRQDVQNANAAVAKAQADLAKLKAESIPLAQHQQQLLWRTVAPGE